MANLRAFASYNISRVSNFTSADKMATEQQTYGGIWAIQELEILVDVLLYLERKNVSTLFPTK